jgi:hypothetical protein
MSTARSVLVHWNYFVALSQDLEKISRFIELHEDNFATHSVELARLLLSAASEVDVVLKLLCTHLDPTKKSKNIDQYREIVRTNLPGMLNETVSIPRCSLTFDPWLNWRKGTNNPDWWKSYNDVKHERNSHYRKANLQSALNALAGLLVIVIFYYAFEQSIPQRRPLRLHEVTLGMEPSPGFMRLSGNHYHQPIVML